MTTLPSFHTAIPLDRAFYERPTLDIARELIGALLVHDTEQGRFSGVIVETEAYVAPEDAACHAYRGVTPRNRVMFGPAGHSYVYRSYGIHYMLNVVTEPEGVAAAVLIRAVEPREGFNRMLGNRGLSEPRINSRNVANIANGPGRLCQAFGIGPELNGADLTGRPLYITAGVTDSAHDTLPIVQTTRIGITRAVDLPWRFYIRGNPHVSVRDRKAEAASRQSSVRSV
jgi:DNA-3-methyladenine glycosylase